jgi:transmembrane sensor
MSLQENAGVAPAADVRDRAAAWLVKRRDHDGWTDADQSDLDAWLAQSPAHKIAYLRVDAAWHRADRLRALRPSSRKDDWLGPALKFAGGAAVAAAVAVFVFTQSPPPHSVTYSTGIGGRETLTLRDGSRIELNTDTTLRLASGAGRQTVYLDKGEAYFRITHDPHREFRVIAGDRRIIDLGTEFLVRRDVGKLRVALYKGKAQFEVDDARGRQQTTLNPGDVVVATADSLSVTRHPLTALTDQLGWQRGLLIFRHATLADAAAEYNRYNLRKIVIRNASVAQLNVNGALPANDPTALARSAQRLFNLHIENRTNEIVILR